MNDFSIIDEYGYDNYEYLNEVIEYSLKRMNVSNAYLSVIFINDDHMQELNKQYRNIDKTTDVLSFAFEDNEEINLPVRMLGDIYVSIPKMQQQAKEYDHSEKRELSFLVVHGLLHLLGYDHTRRKEEEERQFALQDEILANLDIVM